MCAVGAPVIGHLPRRALGFLASQPFWLSWTDGERLVRHTPDFFARRVDGTGLVIDVRAGDRI